MPTRAGWAVVVGAGAGAAAGRMFGVTELYVLAAVAGALVLAAVVWVHYPSSKLTVERKVTPTRVVAGAPTRVELKVTNRGVRRLPPIVIADPVGATMGARLAVGPLGAGVHQDIGYRLPPLRRGLFCVGPSWIEVIDPFGVARRRRPGASELTLTVLPAIDPAPAVPVGGGRHGPLAGLSRRVAAASGVEDLVNLRPYVVGDDLRRVHWPSTARADELQVRRDEDRWQGQFVVLLDTRTAAMSPEDFERAVSAAAGIVDAVATSGDRVRLATTGGADSGMVDARRSAHTLLEDLALVDQGRVGEPDLPQADVRRPAAIVVFTGPDASRLVAALHEAGFAAITSVEFGGDPLRPAPRHAVHVGPEESFADAWQRSATSSALA